MMMFVFAICMKLNGKLFLVLNSYLYVVGQSKQLQIVGSIIHPSWRVVSDKEHHLSVKSTETVAPTYLRSTYQQIKKNGMKMKSASFLKKSASIVLKMCSFT